MSKLTEIIVHIRLHAVKVRGLPRVGDSAEWTRLIVRLQHPQISLGQVVEVMFRTGFT
jgi:hypothetical protein